jgi:hypothetical protein
MHTFLVKHRLLPQYHPCIGLDRIILSFRKHFLYFCRFELENIWNLTCTWSDTIRPRRNSTASKMEATSRFWTRGRLYIRSLPNVTTWLPCGTGRMLFILGSKVKVTVTINSNFNRLIIYIDRRILWCTHFLLKSQISKR